MSTFFSDCENVKLVECGWIDKGTSQINMTGKPRPLFVLSAQRGASAY